MWLIVKAEKRSDIALLNATHNKDLVGADFAEIGRMRNCHLYDAVLDNLLEEDADLMSCMWTSKSFEENDIDLRLDQPKCNVLHQALLMCWSTVSFQCETENECR